jgi:hypothetical protein
MRALITIFTVYFIFSLSVVMVPVRAQERLDLTIKPDGSIEPETDFVRLQRNENTYTFLGDIFGTITVQKAGITIDGAGYTLEGNYQDPNMRGIDLVGHGETFSSYGNVLVKNLRICNFFFSNGIRTPSNNNSFIENRFENAGIHILGGSGVGNVVKNNFFLNSRVFIDYNRGGRDVITENNFFNSGTLVDLADAPFVDRNYWSNYTTKYPNAAEVEGLGIWDTPYVDDGFAWATNRSIDYHPLVQWGSSQWLPDSYIMSFEEAIRSVSKQDYDLWETGSGQTGNASHTSFVSASGIEGYLMWIAPNGTYFEAEYPSGKILGEIGYLRGNNSLNLPPEGYYIWRLNYDDGEAFWVLGHKGTIVRYYPLRGSGPIQPFSEILFYGVIVVAIVVIGLGLLVCHKKRPRGKRQ